MTGLAGWRNEKSLIPGRGKGFISSKRIQTGLGSSQFPIHSIKGAVSMQVLQPEHAVCHAPPSITEIIHEWNSSSSPFC